MNHTDSPRVRDLVVIDDEADLRAVVSDVATELGFSVTEIDHFDPVGDDRCSHCDVIVLDLMMPDVDGIEALRLLAAQGATAHIVLVSGLDRRTLDTAGRVADAQGLNVLGVLTKPFRPRALRELLHDLPESEPRRASRAQPDAVRVGADDIESGLREGQFLMHLQPQVRLDDGAWFGVESLARWQHPEHGLLFPGSFIPTVETSPLALPFTLETLRLALAAGQTLTERTGFAGHIAVNVPPRALADVGFAEEVLRILHETGYPHERLMLEITETSIPPDMTVLLDILTRLRMRGIRLSIDDFGTGHSGLERLRDSPFDELKIDMVFVRGAENDPASHAIVDSAIHLGHRLSMNVLAEGVENATALHWLRNQGCDAVQGFHVCRPLPLEPLVDWAQSDALEESLLPPHAAAS